MYIGKIRVLLLVTFLSVLAACSTSMTSEDSQGNGKNSNQTDDEYANQQDVNQKADFSPNIYFAFDRSSIQGAQARILDAQVEKIKSDGITKIVIEGHTDSIGTTVYNIALGERRANATKKYLVSKGVDANSISVVSYGKSKPMASNDAADGRRQNRRTVTVFN